MAKEPAFRYAVDSLGTQTCDQPDDLFVTCNSFEERCLGIPYGFAVDYRTRYSCIFRYEPNPGEADQFEQDRERRFHVLEGTLRQHTAERVIPIFCNRQSVGDGIGQFKRLFEDHLVRHGCSLVTIDITCFTKLYLFELLHFLGEEAKLDGVRIVYNQPKAYGSANLTEGIGQIFNIPHFAGSFLPNRETVLIVFLGFETERALGIWEHYEPFKTIVVLADPPMRDGYLTRAEKNNAFLLSRPAVIRTTMNPYDPFEIVKKLGELYFEKCTNNGVEIYNIGVMSLGTKVQSVGLFEFWRSHKNVRITYAFPQSYGKSYAERKIGKDLAFRVAFRQTGITHSGA
jgi:hypothetical protein